VQFPINIGLRRSRFLGLALVSTVVLAAGMVMAMPWSMGVRGTICLLVSITACLAWRRLGVLPSAIRLEASGKILVALAGDSPLVEVELQPGVTVHPWLTVMRLKTEAGRVVLLIVAVDTIKAEDFRRLRVFLRWRAEVSGEVGDVP
jgi:toxin CptA